MRMSNFINLSVVAGFFIGLTIGLIKFNEPELVLFLLIIVTICMYLISLTMAAVYTYIQDPKPSSMLANKDYIEQQLDYFDGEFDHTEKEARAIARFIASFELNEQQESIAQATTINNVQNPAQIPENPA